MNRRELADRAARRARALLAGKQARRHGLVGRPELWQLKRDFQIAFLREHGLEPGHVLVDVGCGTLRGGIPIIEYLDDASYIGIDVRAEAIEEARRELHEQGLEHKRPTLVAAPSLDGVDLGRTADHVWAFSVLMHLDDIRLDECLDFVRRHLAADGVCHANAITAELPPARWREFPVISRPVEAYREPAARAGLTLRDIGSLAELGHVTGLAHHDDQRMLELRRS
jgi:cyclopropane fatty-acyl-phospholipid synthase-like methyltransferase